MNIAKVREAQATIREAEKELEQIVKEYLETAPTIKKTYGSDDGFTTDFVSVAESDVEGNKLHITVYFSCGYNDGDYNYSITCEEYEIRYYQPPTDNGRTAQGTVNVIWDDVEKDGKLEPVVKEIKLRKYYQ